MGLSLQQECFLPSDDSGGKSSIFCHVLTVTYKSSYDTTASKSTTVQIGSRAGLDGPGLDRRAIRLTVAQDEGKHPLPVTLPKLALGESASLSLITVIADISRFRTELIQVYVYACPCYQAYGRLVGSNRIE